MNNSNEKNRDIDWEEVILALHAFTRDFMKNKAWFRGKNTEIFLAGKEVDDYVYNAVEIYLTNPEKYKPEKGSLIQYLKYSIIRNIVRYDYCSTENKLTHDIVSYIESNEESEDISSNYLDSMLPFVEALFVENIDYQVIMSSIEFEINGDTVLENIFLGLNSFGMKRREIIEEFEMTDKDYDNGVRRLITIKNRVASKYGLNLQSI